MLCRSPGRKPSFSRLYGRTGQDDPAHLIILESGDGHGHGQIGFTRTRRPQAESNHLAANGVHILLLAQCLGPDGLAADGVTDHIPVQFRQHLLLLLLAQRNGIIHALFLDLAALSGNLRKLTQNPARLIGLMLFSGDGHPPVAVHHGHMQIPLNLAYIGIPCAENLLHMLRRHIHL